VLITGITPFSTFIRTTFSKVHKTLGLIYIALVLFIASPSGLIMAIYANGGIYSKISFTIQAILWFVFTYLAFSYAKNKDWEKHQKFMLRSYALTLSAISLRLFKWMIVGTFELPPMDTYRLVAWLGWVVNLALVEIYLIRKAKK